MTSTEKVAAQDKVESIISDNDSSPSTTAQVDNPEYERVRNAVETTGFYTYEEESKLLRKVDKRLLPLLILLYLVKNLDANNVSYLPAMNANTEHNILIELGMSKNDWAWVGTLYFIPFVLFEIPSTILLKYSTPRVHQFRISFIWGIVTACHAAVQNKEGLYTVRFLLGLFEAGLFPAMLAQLTYWYRSDEITTRMAVLGVLGSFADFLTAFIALGFSYTSGNVNNMSGWRWIFITEGSITVILSFFILFYLPNFPDDSKWLTNEEKAFLVARLPRDVPKVTDKNFSISETKRGMKRPTTWLFSFLKLFQILGTSGMTFWLPTIIQNWGITSSALSPLLNVPVSAVSIISGISFSILVDKALVRPGVLALVALSCTFVSFIVLTTITNKVALYIFIILATLASSADGSVLTSWLGQQLKGTSEVEFIFAFSNGVAQIARIISPQVWRSQYAPRYTVPFGVCLAFIGASLLLVIVIHIVTREKTNRIFAERKVRLREQKKDPKDKPIYNEDTGPALQIEDYAEDKKDSK
jgi:MFS family permease